MATLKEFEEALREQLDLPVEQIVGLMDQAEDRVCHHARVGLPELAVWKP